MWHGTYNRWNPIPQLEGKRLYLEAVHDDWEGMRIWLRTEKSDGGGIIVVRFNVVEAYFSSDESNRLRRIEPEQTLNFPHAFWKVENSQLIDVLNKQSCETCLPGLQHYAILACSDCINVLAKDVEIEYE